jgi:hypothetical protein
MSDSEAKPTKKKVVKETTTRFINNTTKNIFTSAGRCAPGKAVIIPSDEAEKAGLVKE